MKRRNSAKAESIQNGYLDTEEGKPNKGDCIMPRGKSTYRTVTVAGKKSYTVIFQTGNGEQQQEVFQNPADAKSFILAGRRFNPNFEFRILKSVTKEIRWEPK